MWCLVQQTTDPPRQQPDTNPPDDKAEALQQASHLVLEIVDRLARAASTARICRLSVLLTFASRYQPMRIVGAEEIGSRPVFRGRRRNTGQTNRSPTIPLLAATRTA